MKLCKWTFARLSAVGLTTVLGVFGASLLPDLLDQRSICKQADEWVGHHSAHLPQTLDDLYRYPPAYRRSIVEKLPDNIRQEIWRTHLTRTLAKPLTPSQREVVVQLKAIVSPEATVVAPEAGKEPEISALVKAGKAQFSLQEFRNIFADFGPPEGSYGELRSARIGAVRALRTAFDVRAQQDCECRSPANCHGQDCQAIGCDPVIGCGGGGMALCTGICVPW